MIASLNRRLNALEQPSAAMSIDIAALMEVARRQYLAMTPDELAANSAARLADLRARREAGGLRLLERRMLSGLERVLA